MIQKLQNPDNGVLRCYICGYDKFEIYYNEISAGVVVLDGTPSLVLPSELTISAINCNRCHTLHYSDDVPHIGGDRYSDWFIGNLVDWKWDEERQVIVEPIYKRTTTKNIDLVERALSRLSTVDIEKALKLLLEEKK